MLNLVSVNDLIQLTTCSAVSTIFASASFVDLSTVSSPLSSQNTAITTATTTAILSSPGIETVRAVKSLSIFNSSASLSCVVTIQLVNNVPSTTQLFTYMLLPNEQIVYGEEQFIVVSAAGLIKLTQKLKEN